MCITKQLSLVLLCMCIHASDGNVLDVNLNISNVEAKIFEEDWNLSSNIMLAKDAADSVWVNLETCPPGMFCVHETQIPCPIGTYQPLFGAQNISDCLLCPNDTNTTLCPIAGLSDPVDCLDPEDMQYFHEYCSIYERRTTYISEHVSSVAGATSGASTNDGRVWTTAKPDGTVQQHTTGWTTGLTSIVNQSCGAGNTWLNGGCTKCMPGFFCSGDKKNACPAGTFNEQSGGRTIEACEACPLGTYDQDGGRGSVCEPCPVGHVCPNTSTLQSCPLHTTAPEGSIDRAQCACIAGFDCEYSKEVTLRLYFNTSVPINSTEAFMQNPGVLSRLLQDIADACHVNASQVELIGISHVA